MNSLKKCIFCGHNKKPRLFETLHKRNKQYKRKICIECRKIRTQPKGAEQFINRAVSKLKHARKKQGFEWDLTAQEVIDLYKEQKGYCSLTGVKMTHITGQGRIDTNISIDRITEQKIYTRANISLVCVRANLIKHSLNNEQLNYWINKLWINNQQKDNSSLLVSM